MDLSTEAFACSGMAELVERFDDDQTDIKQKQIVWGQDTLKLVHGHIEPVYDYFDRHDHDNDPDGGADRRKNGPYERFRFVQHPIRIQQGQPKKHDAEQFGPKFFLLPLSKSLEELGAVGRLFKIEQVAEVELGQQLYHVFLSRRLVWISLQAFVPYLFHGPIRLEADDKVIGLGAKAKKLIAERIAKEIPRLPAK